MTDHTAEPVPSTPADPMPVFVLKGKDALAPGVIDHYRRECFRHDLGEQAQQVLLAFEEMAAWQRRNWTLVKLPDHPHVPVQPAEPLAQGGIVTPDAEPEPGSDEDYVPACPTCGAALTLNGCLACLERAAYERGKAAAYAGSDEYRWGISLRAKGSKAKPMVRTLDSEQQAREWFADCLAEEVWEVVLLRRPLGPWEPATEQPEPFPPGASYCAKCREWDMDPVRAPRCPTCDKPWTGVMPKPAEPVREGEALGVTDEHAEEAK